MCPVGLQYRSCNPPLQPNKILFRLLLSDSFHVLTSTVLNEGVAVPIALYLLIYVQFLLGVQSFPSISVVLQRYSPLFRYSFPLRPAYPLLYPFPAHHISVAFTDRFSIRATLRITRVRVFIGNFFTILFIFFNEDFFFFFRRFNRPKSFYRPNE